VKEKEKEQVKVVEHVKVKVEETHEKTEGDKYYLYLLNISFYIYI
jgi:hypothetical protein